MTNPVAPIFALSTPNAFKSPAYAEIEGQLSPADRMSDVVAKFRRECCGMISTTKARVSIETKDPSRKPYTNVTGNYAVLHAKLSRPFRDQFTPEKLQQTFKAFADAHVDFDIVVAKPPVPTDAARIDDEGRLLLRGYFDTQPSHVHYDLAFILSEGEWKVIKLHVNVKKVDE